MDKGFFGGVDIKSNSVNSGQNYAAKIDYGFDQWMFHVDGDYSKTLNLSVPTGTKEIKNSDNERSSAAAGVTYFFTEDSYLGLSYEDGKNNYGVVAEEDVRIDLNQQRVDLKGSWWDRWFYRVD